jgi:hypothetical protein
MSDQHLILQNAELETQTELNFKAATKQRENYGTHSAAAARKSG